MPDVKFTKRISSNIMKCGKDKVWVDPNETSRIKEATTRKGIKQLISDGVIIRKPNALKTRYNIRIRRMKKEKGRRCGEGRKKGKASARINPKKVWIEKIRGLRSILKQQREDNIINKKEYRELYYQTKGNLFKTKKNLLEKIHKDTLKKKEVDLLTEQMTAIKTA